MRSDWYMLNAMFQACDVKIAKIAAHSTPKRLPGNSRMNGATAIAWKPRMGIDCRMSSSGTSTFSAARYFEASTAKAQANASEKASAMNIRSVVRIR